MKSMKSLLTLALVFCLLLPLPAGAADYAAEALAEAEKYGFLCEITNQMTLRIIGYTGDMNYVYIPEKIGKLAVTEIGDNAFARQPLREIRISPSIRRIGDCAFLECDLSRVEIPGCEIGESAFCLCTRLGTVVIGGGTKEIGDGAFSRCMALRSLELPDTVERIGESAFRGTMLKEVYIPNPDTVLGEEAFPPDTVITWPQREDVEAEAAAQESRLSFLRLSDVWGLSMEEIARQYPSHIVYQKAMVYNNDMPEAFDVYNSVTSYLPLGWTEHGSLMVLCGSTEYVDGKREPWPEPSLGYIPTLGVGEQQPLAVEQGYPAPVEDQAAGFPATFWDAPGRMTGAVTELRYSHGYLFDFDMEADETLFYQTTITTDEGSFDYIAPSSRYLGERGVLYTRVMIPHGLVHMKIPLDTCEITQPCDRYAYTGAVVYPEVQVTYHGYTLQPGLDYEVVTDCVEPGPATARLRGLGSFVGEAEVAYTICLTEVELDEVEQIAVGGPVFFHASIRTTADAPADGSVEWTLKGVRLQGKWSDTQYTEIEDEYLLDRTFTPEYPGEYELSVAFDGVRATRKFIVEPELHYSIGPLLENGALAEGVNRTRITDCTDIRIFTEYDEANLPFLHEFLTGLTEDSLPFSQKNLALVRQYVMAEKERGRFSLVLRVQPTLAENETSPLLMSGWFEVTTKADQHLRQDLQVSNGILALLRFRTETVALAEGESRAYMPGQSNLSTTRGHLFYFADDYFYSGATAYNNSLAVMSLGLEMAAFSTSESDGAYDRALDQAARAANVMAAYDTLQFQGYAMYGYDQPLTSIADDVAFSLGYRYVSSPDRDDTLVTAVVRGGGYGGEWASNFNVGDGGDHSGFSLAAEGVLANLDSYVQALREEGKLIGDLKVWVMGFSRGGAVANLVGGRLNERFQLGGANLQPSDTYVYCFATPAGRRGVNRASSVFSVISPNDLVPKLAPAAWGFRRYGQDICFPERTPQVVEDTFTAYRGDTLEVSNVGWAENAVIDLLTSLYKDTAAYTAQAQRLIRWSEQVVMQTAEGSFVDGLLSGLVYSLFADMGELVANQSFWEQSNTLFALTRDIAGPMVEGNALLDYIQGGIPKVAIRLAQDTQKKILDSLMDQEEIELITDRITNAVGDTLKSLAVNLAINLTDDERQGLPRLGIMHAHYPEHYLAWLETGGVLRMPDNQAFAMMLNTDRDNIGAQAALWAQ